VPQSARARARHAHLDRARRARLPLGHFGPDNVAPLVVWLATDAARNVNGQMFLAMAGMISLLNYPAPVRTSTSARRWTEIATIFPHTLGMDLVNPAPPQQA
jgi:hypothetical protein